MQPVAANETLAIVSGVYVFDPEEVLFFENLKLSFRGDYDVPLLFQFVFLLGQHIEMLFIILVKFKANFLLSFSVLSFSPCFLF